MEVLVNSTDTHIGKNICCIRELIGLKQEALAIEIGIFQQEMSNIESNNTINKDQLQQIANVLAISTEAITNFSRGKLICRIQNIHEGHLNNLKSSFNSFENIKPRLSHSIVAAQQIYKAQPKIHIGKNIERARKLRRITQTELGLMLGGVSKQAVSKIENAVTIKGDRLQRIAVLLGFSVETISALSRDMIAFHIQDMYDTTVAPGSKVQVYFDPLETIVDLYERMLQIEHEKVEFLTKKLQHVGI